VSPLELEGEARLIEQGEGRGLGVSRSQRASATTRVAARVNGACVTARRTAASPAAGTVTGADVSGAKPMRRTSTR
jgi:hypothetical protein